MKQIFIALMFAPSMLLAKPASPMVPPAPIEMVTLPTYELSKAVPKPEDMEQLIKTLMAKFTDANASSDEIKLLQLQFKTYCDAGCQVPDELVLPLTNAYDEFVAAHNHQIQRRKSSIGSRSSNSSPSE